MEEHGYTLKNGTIVSNEYARQRIVSWLRRHDIPLEERQALAQVTVEDGEWARCLVTYLCHVALEIWRSSWQIQYEERQAEEQRKLIQPPPWPASHGAKVILDGLPNLAKGQVAYVQGDEGNYLWLIVTGGPAASLHRPVDKTSVIPVPNFLKIGPEELIEGLDEDQALVGVLVDQGFTLDRCLTEDDRQQWVRFYQANPGEAFGILHKGPLDGDPVTLEDEQETYWIDTPWPTTVTVATKI